MTVTVAEATTAPEEIKGRSLTQIAWGRLRRDKTFIASAIILAIILLVAIFAPVITGWMGIDPYSLDKTAIDPAGGKPVGPWGGASLEHPLGVEWGTGRDILARLLYGLRISLLIAFAATILVVMTDEHEEAFEDEISWLGDEMPTTASKIQQLAQVTDPYVQWLVAEPVHAKVFGLFYIPGQFDENLDGEASVGIYRVVNETGGSAGHLAQGDLLPALQEIVSAAIGYASTVLFGQTPIPMTLKVALAHPGQDAQEIPRSRVEGFEYDAAANGLIFHGAWVPEDGDAIAVSYLYWVQ